MSYLDKITVGGTTYDVQDSASVHFTSQTLTDAQQRQARDNVGASEAAVTDLVVSPVVYWGDDASQSQSGQSMSRSGGNFFTFDTSSASGDVYWRVNGTLGKTTTSGGASGWSCETVLSAGIPYTISLTPVSGTITGETNAYVRVFIEGGGVSAADAIAQVSLRGGSATFLWPDSTKKAKFIIRSVQAFNCSSYKFYLNLTVNTPIDNAITVAGATPSITAIAGCRYTCSATAVTELTFTPPASGVASVRFVSGSTATVLTLPNTVKMPPWWTSPAANTTYEISFADGYGAVASWT